jgi:hypothetical protein
MDWRERRQALYIGVSSIVLIVLLVILYFTFLYKPGTCFDNTQNHKERGVDCGGPCARMCAMDSRDPVVEWARTFPNGNGTYTGVAYVRNPQPGAGAYGVPYTFRLLDAANSLVIEQSGRTDLPAVGTIPIVLPNIPTGNRTAVKTQFSFLSTPSQPIVWTSIPVASRPTLSVKNIEHADDWSRVSADIVNNTNDAVHEVTVAVVLYGADGNALGASRSVLPEIAPASASRAVFTWPLVNPGVVSAEVIPLPALPPKAATSL